MPAPRSKNNASPSVLDALHAAAPRREVNSCIPVQTYYRSAMNLQRQAEQYRRAKNQEQLYLMLLRYVSLVLETIPRHSDYRKSDSGYQQLLAASASIMEELEQLKMRIRLLDRAALEEAPYLPTTAPGAVKFGTGRVPSGSSSSGGPTDLSYDLEGLGSPEWAAKMTSQSTSTPSVASTNNTNNASKLIAIPDLTPSIALPPASNQMLSKHSLGLPSSTSTSTVTTKPALPTPPEPPSYNDLLASLSNAQISSSAAPSPYSSNLALGPQELAVQTMSYPTQPPPPDASCCQLNSTLSQPPPPPPKSSMTLSKPPSGGVAEVRKRQCIRDVHLSLSLMKEFLRYAEYNTRRGIETCGILAGALSPDDARFTITALIIPKQEGSTDTVHALAEEEIFEAQDSRCLYPLGWIHTHPTQTCFLSSIDVHTQCGYQTMLDEAVAIVMAPSQPRNQMGVFRLTTPGGLSLVQNCPLRGFHAHPPTSTGQSVYEECSNVYLNERIGYEVVDLRGI